MQKLLVLALFLSLSTVVFCADDDDKTKAVRRTEAAGTVLDEIQAAFRAIQEDLKGQYSLGYVSSNKRRDGSFRNIEIRSKMSGIRIRTRKGYYAPKA